MGAKRGDISVEEATEDVIFGGVAMYSEFYGGVANAFYNLGKEYGPMTTYLRWEREQRCKSELIEFLREEGYFK